MADNVQQIKERLNITDVISGYIRLQKAGVNFKALCPFHNEKTPSFMISPSRQSWHCFGCGEGGDIFTFVEKIENIEFRDALKMLADKAGIKLEYDDPKVRSEKDRLYEICELAAEFFTLTLYNPNLQIYQNDANGNPVLNYLYKRGLKDETIDEWRLGYASDSWNSLLNFLSSKGYKEFEMEKVGLIIRSGFTQIEADQRRNKNYQHESAHNLNQSASRYHDRFRNRLMFPIFDANGRVIAFSGRIMSDIIPSKTEKTDSGKYINSPETTLYNKSHILYGLDRAKNEIRKANKVILSEGQMDVILPWQDGVKNIVATSGTALTEEQLLILKRLTDNLILAFDMDEAGFRATKRGIDLAQNSGFNISVVIVPEGKDPADFVKDNPGAFTGLINSPEPIMNYYFKETFKKFNQDSIGGKKFIAVNLLSEIKKIPSAIERSHWLRELGLKLDISEADLKEEMERIEPQINADNTRIGTDTGRESAEDLHPSASKTRKEILSERLLALLLKRSDCLAEAANVAAYVSSADLEFLTAFSQNGGNFSQIRMAIPADLRPRLDFLYMLGDWEIQKADSGFDAGEEINFLIKEIESEYYKEMLIKIGSKIKKYEIEGMDTDNLTKEFQDISSKLLNLSKKQKM